MHWTWSQRKRNSCFRLAGTIDALRLSWQLSQLPEQWCVSLLCRKKKKAQTKTEYYLCCSPCCSISPLLKLIFTSRWRVCKVIELKGPQETDSGLLFLSGKGANDMITASQFALWPSSTCKSLGGFLCIIISAQLPVRWLHSDSGWPSSLGGLVRGGKTVLFCHSGICGVLLCREWLFQVQSILAQSASWTCTPPSAPGHTPAWVKSGYLTRL